MASVYREQDHIPYMIGTMVLGGLGAVPVTYGMLSNISYQNSLVPSLVSCGIFLFAHDKRGNISFFRLIGGIAFVMVVVMGASAQRGGSEHPFFLAGGLLGFVLMAGCGWLGIAIGRALRGTETVAAEIREDQEAQQRAITRQEDQPSATPLADPMIEDPDYQPGNSVLETLMVQTRAAWMAGEMNPLNKVCTVEARSNSMRAFIDGHRPYEAAILRAHRLRAFDENEFLVHLNEEDFVLTSKAFYLFKPGEQVILLRDVKNFRTRGIMNLTLELTMRNEEKRTIPGIDTLPEDRYVQYLAKQSYNAN